MEQADKPAQSWKEAFSVYLKLPVLIMFFLGFSAGLPFLLVFSTLIVWLRKVELDVAIVGYFSWVGLTYSIKVFWAPVVASFKIPVLTRLIGHRRSWMLMAQCGIAAGLLLMSITDPATHPLEMACFALLVAFSSATQDVSIDAYRIESARKEFQAAMAASYILGYRIAVLVAGAGALYLSQYFSWTIAYVAMALCMSVGVVTVLLIREPVMIDRTKQLMPVEVVKNYIQDFHIAFKLLLGVLITAFLVLFQAILLFFFVLFPILLINALLPLVAGFSLFDLTVLIEHRWVVAGTLFGLAIAGNLVIYLFKNHPTMAQANKWIMGAIVGPFADFFHRFGAIIALMVLALIAIYRITDIFMASMAYALYVDLGFDQVDIANITKLFGFLMTLLGAALGGVLVMRFGIMHPLLLGAVMVAITNLLFSQLAIVGENMYWLAAVISADNISGGLAQSAFIAYLSALINKSYTATQYALFSSLMTLLGKFLSGFSGEIVDMSGYFNFFIYASGIGIPGILLILFLIMKKHAPEPVEAGKND